MLVSDQLWSLRAVRHPIARTLHNSTFTAAGKHGLQRRCCSADNLKLMGEHLAADVL
jgi:hypothetical protein